MASAKQFPAAAPLGAAAAVLGLAWRAAWYEPRALTTPELALDLPGWPRALDGLRVALVSDLHAGAGHMTPARLARVVDRALGLGADLYLLLGDYIDSTALGFGRARVRAVAAELGRLPRAVAVLGNHDWNGSGPLMGWALRDAGVPLLENEAMRVRPGLWVSGTACMRHRRPDPAAALAGVPADERVILMTHDPDLFPRVPARADLTVAGHLHRGQVNVPILRHAVIPSAYGDRYRGGHVIEHGRHLFVSAGLGTAGVPARLRALPEVPVLRLRAGGPA